MAPNQSAMIKAAAPTITLEDYILRWFILALTRAACDISRFDYEDQLLQLQQIISSLPLPNEKLYSLMQLARLAWRCIIACSAGVEFPVLTGVREFCQCLQHNRESREKWEPLILLCTSKSLRTWIEKEQPTPEFSILKVAIENWEWNCFRHYRDSFRHWAFQERPCNLCTQRLEQMSRHVEYDRVEAAERYLQPTSQNLSCIPSRYAKKDLRIPSVEPFIMILRQAKNRRWMALWAPLIHMHTGFTVDEIQHSYIDSSHERDKIEETTTAPKCIPGVMFEERDVEHISDTLDCEQFLIDRQIEECLRQQDEDDGTVQATPRLGHWVPT